MKAKVLASLLVGATCLTAPVLSFADHDDGWRGDHHWEHGDDRHWDRGDRDDHHWREHEWREDRDWHRDRVVYVRPYQSWHRGGYIPVEYRAPRYYVEDWRAYDRLYAPPRGYRWMYIDGDYVLAAIASNVIANIILGR